MTVTHVQEQRRHDHNFEDKIEPGLFYQQTDVQSDCAGVERQYIGVLHQWKTLCTELIT